MEPDNGNYQNERNVEGVAESVAHNNGSWYSIQNNNGWAVCRQHGIGKPEIEGVYDIEILIAWY